MQQPGERRVGDRVAGVDALRGYAILLYVCGVPLLRGVAQVLPGSASTVLLQQFSHETWHGLTYYDIGFPAYIMLMGAAVVFATSRQLSKGVTKRHIYIKALQRTLVLLVLGLIFNCGFSTSWPNVRVVGVLQRLAICYFCAVWIYLQVPSLGRWVVLAAILLGYWAALALVPVPGYGAGDYSYEGNLVAYVDSVAKPVPA